MIGIDQIQQIAEAKARQVLGTLHTYFSGTTEMDELVEAVDLEVTDYTSNLLSVSYVGFNQALALAGQKLVMVKAVAGVVTVTAIDTQEQNELSTAGVTVTTDGTTVQINLQGLDGETILWNGYYDLLTVLNEPIL